MLAAILRACEYPCPAMQDAVDRLADEFGDPNDQSMPACTIRRDRMINWLVCASRTQLCDKIMCAWARAPLKRATGLDRDQWLRVIDAHGRAEFAAHGRLLDEAPGIPQESATEAAMWVSP